ncbi:MAG: hypothetical protein Kow0068_15180 [Marinilabiliales bacterium]
MCKVTEIGINEIKYKEWDNLDGPNIVIRKSDVQKIVYKNGKVSYIVPDEYDMNQEAQIIDKQRAVKFAPFSPLFNKMEFGYEQVLKVGQNIETKIGYIGIGADNDYYDSKVYGGYLSVGYKFLLGKDFYINGLRYVHSLKGHYFKFQATYSYFIQKNVLVYISSGYPNYSPQSVKTDYNNNSLVFNIIYGRQFIIGNMFTLDYYIGVGYGYAGHTATNSLVKNTDNYYNPNYFYSHSMMTNSACITGGLSIGYIF